MIHLMRVEIHGFKNPRRNLLIEFPDTQLSVIYGRNGSGKTTFLKILHAIFKRKDDILAKESVESIVIEYKKNRNDLDIHKININKLAGETNTYDWSEIRDNIPISSSILFGVNRSVIQERLEISTGEIEKFIIDNQFSLDLKNSKNDFIEKFHLLLQNKSQERENSMKYNFDSGVFDQDHLIFDELKIDVIQALLLKHFKRGSDSNILKFIKIYNSYVSKEKEIIISQDDVKVKVGEQYHDLSQLSSGERHLLTFLAVFILEGSNKDILMIDEPEMSLDTRWQRKIMNVFMEACPNSQIIVASHSPSIGYPDTDNIVKMK
jgi:energy-coupling factor transporter ATP-binding protein EcfA2